MFAPLLWQDAVRGFSEAMRAYREIFPDSEERLFKLARALTTTYCTFSLIHGAINRGFSCVWITEFLTLTAVQAL